MAQRGWFESICFLMMMLVNSFVQKTCDFFAIFWKQVQLNVIIAAFVGGVLGFFWKTDCNWLVSLTLAFSSAVSTNTLNLRKSQEFSYWVFLRPLGGLNQVQRFTFYWNCLSFIVLFTGLVAKAYPFHQGMQIFQAYCIATMVFGSVFGIRNFILLCMYGMAEVYYDWLFFIFFYTIPMLSFVWIMGVLPFENLEVVKLARVDVPAPQPMPSLPMESCFKENKSFLKTVSDFLKDFSFNTFLCHECSVE
jgi:hypothetical protein